VTRLLWLGGGFSAVGGPFLHVSNIAKVKINPPTPAPKVTPTLRARMADEGAGVAGVARRIAGRPQHGQRGFASLKSEKQSGHRTHAIESSPRAPTRLRRRSHRASVWAARRNPWKRTTGKLLQPDAGLLTTRAYRPFSLG
jgi:hypothetical protein